MSILRQFNWLGQGRVDVAHMRLLESSIVADLDTLVGRVDTGGKAVVVRGMTLSNYGPGTPAADIQLSTADSIVYNVNATEAGTFLWTPANRPVETLNSALNPRVDGSFTAGQVNYIGLDFKRSPDASTTDLVKFQDPYTVLETPKTVPLGILLDYRIVISTTPFSAASNILPIAKVRTTAQNLVASGAGDVEDARNLMYRLGSGGDFPNRYNTFSWPQSRLEQDPAISALSSLDKFAGGDKDIRSQKDWQDAVMSRLWEIGGGQNWYSPTSDRNLKMVGAPYPSVFASTSDNFEWGIESGSPALGLYSAQHLHWQGLRVLFENSNVPGVWYNQVADQTADDPAGNATASKTALADGDCIYVDLDRTSNATVVARKASIRGLGTPAVPGSRLILAWRSGSAVFRRDSVYPINNSYTVATIGSPGSVRLAYAAGTPITPTVPPLNSVNAISIGTGSYTIIGNNQAITAVGGGTGFGLHGTGGLTGGGVYGSGGATSGRGGTFVGTGGADGARGTSAAGHGLYGITAGSLTAGVYGDGGADGYGVFGKALGVNTGGRFEGKFGVQGYTSTDGGAAVYGQSGSAKAPAGLFEGFASDDAGGGTSPAVQAIGGDAGDVDNGGHAFEGTGGNAPGVADAGSGARLVGGDAGGVAVAGSGLIAVGGASNGAGPAGKGATLTGGAKAGATGGTGAVIRGGTGTTQGVGMDVQGSNNLVDGPINQTNGQLFTEAVTVSDADGLNYASAQAKYIWVPMSDFKALSGVATVADPTNALVYYGSLSSGTTENVAKIRLPHDAIITSIQFLATNVDSISRLVGVSVAHNEYSVSGFTTTQVQTGAVPQLVSVVVNASPTWKTVSITAGLVSPRDGITSIYFQMPQTTSSDQIRIRAFRIGYTYQIESPMR